MNNVPPSGTVLININVFPSQEVGAECVKMSQSLKSDDTMFVLDGETKFPHMTVFMARFPVEVVPQVIEAVKRILANTKSFRCEHTTYFTTAGDYYEVSYDKTAPFVALHEAIIDAVKGLRANPGNPHEEPYFKPYTAEQRKNAEETGYDLAHNLFRPHITLTRYFPGKVPATEPNFPPNTLSFNLHTVCVYEANENGAVTTELARFSVN